MRALPSATASRPVTAPWSASLTGALAVVLLTLAAAAPLLIGGTVVGQDTAAFFGPMYGFLGDRLRAGALPVWNPYQFSGAPFLADPESGWLYWPAMLLFTALPVATALRAYLVVHLLLAAVSTYLFGRLIGLSLTGAVTAAGAYVLSGVVYGRSVCCPAYLQVAAWLPAALLAVELALRASDWPRRLGWTWLGAFAVSQIVASWLGQGMYYALLVLGGYVVYRAVEMALTPQPCPLPASPDTGEEYVPCVGEGERRRAQSDPSLAQWFGRGVARQRRGEGLSAGPNVLLVGLLTATLGILLAAAAILPRFEFRAASNLAEGYGGDLAWAARLGGWGIGDYDNRLFAPGLTYLGGAVALLALLAVVVAWRRPGVPFFALMTVGTLLLTTAWPNPLQRLLGLLPGFAELHQHWPERALVVFPLAPALLAGALVSATAALAAARWRPLVLLLLVPLTMLGARLAGAEFHPLAIGGAAGTSLLVALAPWTAPRPRRWLPPALGAVVVVELIAAGLLTMRDGPYGGFHRLDLDRYFGSDGVAAVLTAPADDEPARFAGYNPVYREIESDNGQVTFYRYGFAEPGTRALLVNNLGTHFALADVQGYNPLQLKHYVEFMAVLNGTSQEYHGSWVLPTGIDSPLLDLLGVRYLVLPAVAPPDRPEIERLVRAWPLLYRDAEVRVIENPNAFRRAWLVHTVVPGDAATLASGLAAGTLDLRTAAVVAAAPATLSPAPDPEAERVTETHRSPESLTLRVRATAPALLVTSEVAYPAWRAYVDGEPVAIVRANVAFRAVPVPAGEHTVEFRYESTALFAGLLLSGAGYFGAGATVATLIWRRTRRRRSSA